MAGSIRIGSPPHATSAGCRTREQDPRRSLERYIEAGENGALAPEPPRRAHPASMQPARKGLVMKKILSLAFVAMRFLPLPALFVAFAEPPGGFATPGGRAALRNFRH